MSAAGINVLHVCKLNSIKNIAKKVPLKTSTLLSLKQHCSTIFLNAKCEQYAVRRSRVEV